MTHCRAPAQLKFAFASPETAEGAMQAAGRDLSPAQQQVRAPAASSASQGYPTYPRISVQSTSDRKSGTRT